MTLHFSSGSVGSAAGWDSPYNRTQAAVEQFRLRFIEWCIKAYALGKVWIRDVVPTEGNQVTSSFGDRAGSVFGVNSYIRWGAKHKRPGYGLRWLNVKLSFSDC